MRSQSKSKPDDFLRAGGYEHMMMIPGLVGFLQILKGLEARLGLLEQFWELRNLPSTGLCKDVATQMASAGPLAQ